MVLFEKISEIHIQRADNGWVVEVTGLALEDGYHKDIKVGVVGDDPKILYEVLGNYVALPRVSFE